MDSRIDNANYASDPRTQGAPPVTLHDPDGNEIEVVLKWVVCPVCNGEGKHVNPAIDAGGLNEDMADDPEFMERYADGFYDMPCTCCMSRSTIKVIDESRLTAEQADWLTVERQADADWDAERLAEIRAGC